MDYSEAAMRAREEGFGVHRAQSRGGRILFS